MILLDTVNRKLQVILAGAKTTSDCPWVASYADIGQSGFTMSGANSATGNTNGVTAVDTVASPAASTTRQLKFFSLFNADTAAITPMIRYNDNGTIYKVVAGTLQVSETLAYNAENGWSVYDATGSLKTTVGFGTASANTVLAGPTSGSAAAASYRALVGADLPNPSATTLGGVKSLASVSHNFLTQLSTTGALSQAQPATTDLSDVSIGTWTPTDSSGASLTFSGISASYTVLGNLVFAYARFTYPATASGASAVVGGLPFTCATPTYAAVPANLTGNASFSFAPILEVNRAGTAFGIYDNFNGNPITNAQLANSTQNVLVIYPIT